MTSYIEAVEKLIDQQDEKSIRIRELESKLALMIFERDEVMIFERDEAWKRAAHSEKMWGEAEVKLAKAVEALLTIVDNGGAGSYHLARATLAEIKGERHD